MGHELLLLSLVPANSTLPTENNPESSHRLSNLTEVLTESWESETHLTDPKHLFTVSYFCFWNRSSAELGRPLTVAEDDFEILILCLHLPSAEIRDVKHHCLAHTVMETKPKVSCKARYTADSHMLCFGSSVSSSVKPGLS